jgi:hypothetical protein
MEPRHFVKASEPTVEGVLAAIESSGASPQAVEAFWDGDTEGWFVVLSAACVVPPSNEPVDLHLGMICHGGDIRLFTGDVPPWPEAVSAQSLGHAVSARLGIPFYFPSPMHPEDACPRWRERDLGVPCRACGIPLLQDQGCPWLGTCYDCHLREEREARR